MHREFYIGQKVKHIPCTRVGYETQLIVRGVLIPYGATAVVVKPGDPIMGVIWDDHRFWNDVFPSRYIPERFAPVVEDLYADTDW